ncbi:NAD(P)-binding domain protein [Cordyceps fumosorosea ARSEF 2679]|uniref:Very-long-chain 3-oxoacyl-CoA reductase n=1 Tax=Cordyceps fumosorosea (strain ARSEF 2679) TaxID=1081104 RepID=A0A167R7F7_CORFA|nr:NAD(P)-binding domain protein [Cordyceps fumosorosea ARSEF 2679]OAA58341.1 NAD(P)-binding domain protein [Cordyceps fumosorosea ARSEF 2679]
MDKVNQLLGKLPAMPHCGLVLLATIGGLFVASKLFSYLRLVLGSFILPGTNLRTYGKPGTWAVVTGASDGLGKEFASQLAATGFNLVLVSRTQSKLDALANEITAKYTAQATQVKTLAMDFTQDNDADYERLAALVRGLDVGILINNVGQSHSIPVSFLETPRDELQNIVTINCLGTLKVTQVVAPILKQRRGRGLVLTMGSFGGWTPTPYLATYSGSKAFLQQWSNALAAELADDGVDVQLVLSHLVTTAMSKIRRASLLVPNARPFVKAALGKVGTGGYQTAPNTYTPWWSHAFMLWFIENIPGVNSPLTISINKGMHLDIRKRALRKAEREAKKQ